MTVLGIRVQQKCYDFQGEVIEVGLGCLLLEPGGHVVKNPKKAQVE